MMMFHFLLPGDFYFPQQTPTFFLVDSSEVVDDFEWTWSLLSFIFPLIHDLWPSHFISQYYKLYIYKPFQSPFIHKKSHS